MNTIERSSASRELLDVEKARAQLAACTDLVVIKKMRDQADAMARYLRAQKAGDEAATRASVIAREAEVRAGELLKGMQLHRTHGQGGRPKRERIPVWECRCGHSNHRDDGECGDCHAPKRKGLEYEGRVPGVSEHEKTVRTTGSTVSAPLASLGVTRSESTRFQSAASVPEAQRKKLFDAAIKANKPVSASVLPKLARDAKRREAAVLRNRAAVGSIDLRHCGARELLAQIAPASVDLLLTDPPYSTDVRDVAAFASEWLPDALSKVKPSGRAYVCIGAYPDELRAYLGVAASTPGLTLANVLVWTYRNTMGPSPNVAYKLNWQAILYFHGPDAPPLDCPELVEKFSVQDINAPDGRQGDRYHAWQKPDELAERFVRHASAPGQLVLDPFAGTGTFLLAAARLGRNAIGCEINPQTLAIAKERGCTNARRSAA